MDIKTLTGLAPEYIEWNDIAVCPETWAGAKEISTWYDDVADALVEQVGYIISEDDKCIIISESMIESMELFGTVTKIPKSVIRKRVKLIFDEPK